MTAASIVVQVTRALWHHGESVPAGATLKCPALEAQHLLDSGRARLVHAADERLCQDALRADVRAALKAERAAQVAPPEVGP